MRPRFRPWNTGACLGPPFLVTPCPPQLGCPCQEEVFFDLLPFSCPQKADLVPHEDTRSSPTMDRVTEGGESRGWDARASSSVSFLQVPDIY